MPISPRGFNSRFVHVAFSLSWSSALLSPSTSAHLIPHTLVFRCHCLCSPVIALLNLDQTFALGDVCLYRKNRITHWQEGEDTSVVTMLYCLRHWHTTAYGQERNEDASRLWNCCLLAARSMHYAQTPCVENCDEWMSYR